MKYPKLFEPFNVQYSGGALQIPNRFIMGSMHTGLEDKLEHITQLKDYFVERALGKVGLIITGGYSPNYLGRLTPFAGTFNSRKMARAHREITDGVHAAGSKICLQLLHAGRYSYHPFSVAPSRIKSPITPFTPFALPHWMVKSTIQDFAKAAVLAQEAGYDGVEVMGSEGYLVHQFFSERTNHRTDNYGGSLENRVRFALEIVRAIRAKLGESFLIVFRIPILDLVSEGSNWSDVTFFAQALEKAGVNLLNSGIGWHESRIPTIASMVPEAAFASVTGELKKFVKIPVVATNRFNEPGAAEKALRDGNADFISMARPFLADPHFVKKAESDSAAEINYCIACNQACLDHIFKQKRASCMVNPTACEEKTWEKIFSKDTAGTSNWQFPQRKIAVVGAGAAGLNAAIVLLRKGHSVKVFESAVQIGGQFNLAALVPGKKDYARSIVYWKNEITRLGGEIETSSKINHLDDLKQKFKNFDHVVVATGVTPRKPKIKGDDLPHVFPYDVYLGKQIPPGKKVAIVGAGGIGFDVAAYVLQSELKIDTQPAEFFKYWNIDPRQKGGLASVKDEHSPSFHHVTLLQRSDAPFGRTLGKTTGWIHRLELKRERTTFLKGLVYEEIVAEGIWVRFADGKRHLVEADQIVLCAGQESVNSLVSELTQANIPHSLIGGAKLAGELDAKRAIREAYDLAKTDL
jgi:2,4-dienoyl-CoA reductase (NADPH2)